eukprot:CAMPEP_0117427960 /NCGR_PEP_ID=MMETSP0758-20121206/7750_1 /TAXON_ID=63605 /ORGANISM="Percolomonas cosmopolitus, Strain AE-1 (ATCC 50343)" /LENGTH=335 /DNA_ID=CAMNT_0005214003 /DNA_START=208 /DNA_END=1212 /DNA_ORIENTATION=+
MTIRKYVKTKQTTNNVLMIRPNNFTFNPQTAKDNEFQDEETYEKLGVDGVREGAKQHFDESVDILRKNGVNVLVLEGDVEKPFDSYSPDEIFPNNWISTHEDGTIVIYTMKSKMRAEEANRLPEVMQLFKQAELNIRNKIDLREKTDKILEGTGSYILDHESKTIYVALSQRSEPEAIWELIREHPLIDHAITFRSVSEHNQPFYHTNVMCSFGIDYSVICLDSIKDKDEKEAVIQALNKRNKGEHTLIDISFAQTEKGFCGNMLELKNGETGERLFVMSESSLGVNGFTDEQQAFFKKRGKILALPTSKIIEPIGGGSARCMIAEIFLDTEEQA